VQRQDGAVQVLEGKEVKVGEFSDSEEAKGAIRHAMELYDEHFASSAHTTKGAEQGQNSPARRACLARAAFRRSKVPSPLGCTIKYQTENWSKGTT
jgi:hypothetical protein